MVHRPLTSMSTSSLLYFSGHEINSSVRSSAGWNNILVHNLSCQCTDTSLGNNNAGRESKSISRVSTCVRKIKKPSLPRQRGLTDSPKEWRSAGAWRWPMCCWRLAGQQGPQTGRLQEVGSPRCWAYAQPPSPRPRPLRPWGLCNDRDCWEKKLTSREQTISSTCLLENFSGIINYS